MPVYEYECGACGHQFEEWQKMSDTPIKTCPKCGKDEVQRLISRTSFQLKGGGWYSDLYSSSKSNGKGGSGGGETKSSGSSGSSGDAGGKAESSSSSASPATKPEPKAGTVK